MKVETSKCIHCNQYFELEELSDGICTVYEDAIKIRTLDDADWSYYQANMATNFDDNDFDLSDFDDDDYFFDHYNNFCDDDYFFDYYDDFYDKIVKVE